MPQRIVYSADVAGFVPERWLLQGLFAAHPEAFDEPFDPADFFLDAQADDEEVARKTIFGLLRDGQLYFIRSEAWVRTLPWLVEAVQSRGGRGCVWRGGSVNVRELSDGVAWELHIDDDGREAVVLVG